MTNLNGWQKGLILAALKTEMERIRKLPVHTFGSPSEKAMWLADLTKIEKILRKDIENV